jgi:hypothetical protein
VGKNTGRGRTGEVADGNGDGGDGGEADVVERREVADHLSEGRVPVQHRVLRLRRRGDVRVHRGRGGWESYLRFWRRRRTETADLVARRWIRGQVAALRLLSSLVVVWDSRRMGL